MNLLIIHIINFVKIVNDFNEAIIKKYNLTDTPYSHVGKEIKRKDSFEYNGNYYSYIFHGAGCYIKLNNLNVNYDIVAYNTSRDTIKITKNDITFYLESLDESIQLENIEELLVKLESEKKIKKVENTRGQYEILENIYNNTPRSPPLPLVYN